jgi:hypothetical protein
MFHTIIQEYTCTNEFGPALGGVYLYAGDSVILIKADCSFPEERSPEDNSQMEFKI